MAKVTFTIHKAGKHQRHSRRNQILDAAQRCFKKQGFHKTTLRDIAQEFGMSAGHIYNYFSNKEAIIEALVELRTQEFLDMIDTDKFADLSPKSAWTRSSARWSTPTSTSTTRRSPSRS